MNKGDCEIYKLNIFEVYRPQIISLLTFIIEWKSKFRLQFSENKVVIFSTYKFTEPLKTIPWTPANLASSIYKVQSENKFTLFVAKETTLFI
jgi:hypothetical protein